MQHIDPYSDDFFKKAAEDYPLRTDAGEWGDVAKKLNTFEQGNKIITRRNYRNIQQRSVLVCALLLIPFAIAVTKYFHIGYKAAVDVETKNTNDALSATSSTKVSDAVNFNKRKQDATSILGIEKSVASYNGEIVKVRKDFSISFLQNEIEKQESLNNSLREKSLENNTANVLTVGDKKNLKEAAETSSDHKNNGGKNAEVNTNKYNGFYIGGAIAPELTSVKFQPARKSFDIGLLVGYNLNKKVSVELGFMLAQKYYYTSGKYVVPNSIGPQDSKIIAVNAFNSVTEMPLTIQYNLSNKNDTKLFASAGAVSYIVHKENYNYTYSKDGEEKQGKTLSNKASQNWFSNVQMSVGYEHSFNKVCNIRVEPYCRIPLKGIGISNLPVTSIGVNLALIKTIK